MATTNDEKKFYMSSGCVGKDFYEKHIKDEVSKATQKKFEALLNDEDEDFIEYYRVSISNPDDKAWEFSSLWFFDINLEQGWYMPVFKSGVNTSSCLAMEMCGMDREDEDEEDNTKTLEELLDYAPNRNQKSKDQIKRILLLKRTTMESADIMERRKWVEDYNNSLPQKKWFDTEFEKEMSIGIGGIYDSEYMNFIYDNIKSKRIEELLKKE